MDVPPQAPCTCSCTGTALRNRVARVSVDPKRMVADGYDAIFDVYERWEEEQGDGARGARIDAVLPLVPSRRSALDLGCGTGTKATAYLAREFEAPTGDARRRQPETTQRTLTNWHVPARLGPAASPLRGALLGDCFEALA